MSLRCLAIAFSVLACSLPAAASPKAVIELFTSQGCSSCPPADALLERLATDRDLIALTMPVTIWDYLGWADTLASPELTKRQIAYGHALGDVELYTPQAVINGRAHALGSDRVAIMREVAEQNAAGPALPVPVGLTQVDDVLDIELGAAAVPGASRATVWLLTVEPEVNVPIQSGENRGRRLSYRNVVRDMRPIGVWKNRPVTIELPIGDMRLVRGFGRAVLVQEDTVKGPGPIIGAALLPKLASHDERPEGEKRIVARVPGLGLGASAERKGLATPGRAGERGGADRGGGEKGGGGRGGGGKGSR